MILTLVLAALAGLVAFLSTARWRRGTRMAIAAAAFLIPTVGMAALVFSVGDPAPPGSITVIDPARSPTAEQVAAFQVEANKACKCAERSGVKETDSCWARYNAITKPFNPETITSACLRTHIHDVFPGTGEAVSLDCRAARENAELAEADGGKLTGGC